MLLPPIPACHARKAQDAVPQGSRRKRGHRARNRLDGIKDKGAGRETGAAQVVQVALGLSFVSQNMAHPGFNMHQFESHPFL